MLCTWSVHENTCTCMCSCYCTCSESDSNSAAVSANNNIQVNEKYQKGHNIYIGIVEKARA